MSDVPLCSPTSPPLVLGIPPLQLLFQLRIGVAPEVSEVLGDLYGALAGGEDLDAHADAVLRDPQGVHDAIQVLDARGDGRRGVGGVNNLNHPSFGQLNSLRRVLFDPRLLLARQPRFDYRQHGTIFYFVVTEVAMAEVLDHNGSVLFGDGGQFQLWHP